MKTFKCPNRLCALNVECPLSHLIPASEQSIPDEVTGEILYFAVCEEMGDTFCDLHKEDLVNISMEDRNQSKTLPSLEHVAEVIEPEVIDSTALMTTSPEQLPALLQGASTVQEKQMLLQVATLKGMAQIHKDVEAFGLTANRIDERTRKEAERRQEKQEQRSVDQQLWAIWKDYLRGKYGVPVTKHKRAVKDLLVNEQTRGLVANLGVFSNESLEKAIRREDRRIKKKEASGITVGV